MKNKDKYALVLAGGGAKGTYQIGAWKALNELGIEICAVTGASVGALNAALIAQKNYEQALDLWENISLDRVVKLPPELILDGKFHFRKFNFFHLREINKSILQYGGLDSTPLKNLINSYVNEESIRRSGIDFGLVTVNVNRLKPVEIFLNDIPQGQLGQYLLASSSFPTFKQAEIDGRKYTDGGVYDNIPYRMIKERGYKKIIIVDLAGPGFNRKPDIEGTETIYIKNTSDIGSVLNFNKGILKVLLTLGYLDTMKTFGKIDGIKYFYKSDKKIERDIITKLGKDPSLRKILPKGMRQYRDIAVPFFECAALILGIDQSIEYKMSELFGIIEKRYYEIINRSDYKDKKHLIRVLKNMKKNMKQNYGERDFLAYPPFEYLNGLGQIFTGSKLKTAEKTLKLFFPMLPAGLYFIDKVIKDSKQLYS
ncbi:MAG: patatin-like phospholipase family protein [Spirochaetia bacterium]|jgi:NTE family protein|nr:patatin-like phospholipase family protein [Spirochaetia bacterium]